MKNIKYFSIILMLFATLVTFGQSKKNGTAGATELLIPVGARGIAMGNANLTNSLGANAIFWNPANLSRCKNNVDVLVSHMNYIADLGIEYGAIGVNMGDFGSVALSIKSLGFGDILKTSKFNPDGTGQTFSPQYTTIGLTYSKLLSDRVSVGANINYVTENIDLVSASGLSFDFGVTYSDLAAIKGFSMAIILKNIGPDMKFDGSGLWIDATDATLRRGSQKYKIDAATFSLPTTLDIGLGYKLAIDDDNYLDLAGAFVNQNYYSDQYKIGAEYGFSDLIFIRAGYVHTTEFESDEVLNKFTAGFGLKYEVNGVGFKLDYAYLPTQYFSDTHVISVSLGIR